MSNGISLKIENNRAKVRFRNEIIRYSARELDLYKY